MRFILLLVGTVVMGVVGWRLLAATRAPTAQSASAPAPTVAGAPREGSNVRSVEPAPPSRATGIAPVAAPSAAGDPALARGCEGGRAAACVQLAEGLRQSDPAASIELFRRACGLGHRGACEDLEQQAAGLR